MKKGDQTIQIPRPKSVAAVDAIEASRYLLSDVRGGDMDAMWQVLATAQRLRCYDLARVAFRMRASYEAELAQLEAARRSTVRAPVSTPSDARRPTSYASALIRPDLGWDEETWGRNQPK